MPRRSLYLFLVLVLAIQALPAYGYLDPASGSMVLQLLLGGVAGVALVVKLYWHKFLGLFGIKHQEHDDPST